LPVKLRFNFKKRIIIMAKTPSISFPEGTFGQNLGAQLEGGLQDLQDLLLQIIEESPVRAGARAAASSASETSSASTSVSACSEASPSEPDMSQLFGQALDALLGCKNNGWIIKNLAAIDKKYQELFGQGLFGHELGNILVEKALVPILHSLWQEWPVLPQIFIAEIASQGGLNSRDERGYTLLFEAVELGHPNIVKALIEAGADVDATDGWGRTALHVAAESGNPELIKLPLAHEANIHAIDCFKRTPLHWAALKGHPDIALDLIARGAKLNEPDNMGRTPLHWAALQGHLADIKALIAAGADVNKADNDGRTALYLAENWGGGPEAIACLKAHKAKAAAEVAESAPAPAPEQAQAQAEAQDPASVEVQELDLAGNVPVPDEG
jgi:hypothetical protein